ncbi:ctr copper transporter [Colletotrichum lupini]|uniref:Copper transport protein n=3 Tax=Colletotrichum acutatum species complex TaxID=2707335 RepID=A0A9Q8WNJ7_9PEZI|nr:ctr copper transporter [Colletotrichum lupini]XP_060311479.1 ctr copper transporter [Colletotrichum costaricense]KAI3546520.1 ctr copper transporter [Colletotrichum filicis]KAK0369153.1 ctr copper transporter [Colletotrichum limetticola]KAK1522446.1 ctr copper transporter [Colletotrichum costaricense]KAK1714416.1 Ctr copper transporter family-domain-containing protein [Colletotrichum lupini]UQC90188.1 ctr copper transporter [Colletotrichum lupini]
MDMNMATSTAMAMATSTSAASGDMSSMSMSMSEMAMTFFEAFQTPLYSDAWTPTSPGQYAGTCIFLIVLGSILRLLLALKPVLEDRFWRNYPVYESDKQALTSHHAESVEPGQAGSVIRKDIVGRWKGWRAGAAAARATYEVIVGGIGYLLMLAVMTMNVGYFLSVLSGVWLGTFLLGGLAGGSPAIHC